MAQTETQARCDGRGNGKQSDDEQMTRLDDFLGVEDDATDGQQASIQPGTYVRDKEEDDDSTTSRMIVVDRPGMNAEESAVSDGKTVADYNPEYPSDDPVVIVVYENDALDGFGTRGSSEQLVELYSEDAFEERDVRTYSYPESRLTPTDDQTGIGSL